MSERFKGSRSYHCFIPVSEQTLEMKRVSTDQFSSSIHSTPLEVQLKEAIDYVPEMYVACTYDQNWYIANVIQISPENHDIYCKFMKRNNRCFSWRVYDDKCWVLFNHVICEIKTLTVQGRKARFYSSSDSEYKSIIDNVNKY